MRTISEIFALSPVIPVVTIDDVEQAVPLAQALAAGGVPIIEVTLRTATALGAIAAIAADVPEICLGVGTIWTATDLHRAIDAGAHFGVSPGATSRLLDAVVESRLPFLPGCQTASEIADRVERGFEGVKFFPAETSGGAPALKGLTAVFPDTSFCPTGGVKPTNARDYLGIRGVDVVGGSWLTPKDAVAAGDWSKITATAREAAALTS